MTLEAKTAIEQMGIKPHLINGSLVNMIRWLFSTPENIENENLKERIWSNKPEYSKILIEAVYRWKPEDIQQRPAVIVKRGAWKLSKLGMGDRRHGPPEATGFTEAYQTIAGAGTHTFFCLGNSGLEAEEVGEEVYGFLLGFSAVIREQLCLGIFQVAEIGEVARFEESHDHFVVPVSVSYNFQLNWKLLRQTPEWMRTTMDPVL